MGRLAGYRYREIVKPLKERGLRYHRQAAGSHEIWFNELVRRYTTIPNHPGDMPEGTCERQARTVSGMPASHRAKNAVAPCVPQRTNWMPGQLAKCQSKAPVRESGSAVPR
jgi:predicted RNA binding protein YcfA (HicA-like mRNA interferase family)